MAEGRESLSKVTQCVNGLVDLPIELAGLKRSIQTIANQSSTHTPSSHPPQPPPASETQTAVPDTHRAKGSTGTKRIQRAFSPVAEPEAKRAKTVDDAFWFDVYMWDVKPQFGSAYQIGRAALEALKMSTDAYLSAMHLNGLPKTLVSLRFSDAEVARMFIERMRGNPPKGMEHLEVATAASYGKRKEGNSGNVTRKPKESKFCLNIVSGIYMDGWLSKYKILIYLILSSPRHCPIPRNVLAARGRAHPTAAARL
ncbi:hypothetical protein B0H13DRAFT_569369 [Mycena leptocephala]|nr:hypothetical protein B0H13DRAFT_569369 [Mycena leptocephala]